VVLLGGALYFQERELSENPQIIGFIAFKRIVGTQFLLLVFWP
jgi:hypothetical protein